MDSSVFHNKLFNIFVYYMKYFIFLLIFISIFSFFGAAQTDSSFLRTDTLRKDTVKPVKKPDPVNDSLPRIVDSTIIADSLLIIATDSVLLTTKTKAIIKDETKAGETKIFSGKEDLFYYLIFLLLLFGLLRIAFTKYFTDLFRVFFRTTLKQKQTREQLLQSPLPSVLMNCFFVLTTGLYINFLLINFGLSLSSNFWLQYLYCMLAISFIYIVKFLGLKLVGWMFNVYEATESYIFIVFIINKMLGIMFLPFLLLLAFTSDSIYDISLLLSWISLGLLLGYRIILSTAIARNEIKFKTFHFILYVLGFEVVPVLLIYKLLMFIF